MPSWARIVDRCRGASGLAATRGESSRTIMPCARSFPLLPTHPTFWQQEYSLMNDEKYGKILTYTVPELSYYCCITIFLNIFPYFSSVFEEYSCCKQLIWIFGRDGKGIDLVVLASLQRSSTSLPIPGLCLCVGDWQQQSHNRAAETSTVQDPPPPTQRICCKHGRPQQR
jgi:hypothetical protein